MMHFARVAAATLVACAAGATARAENGTAVEYVRVCDAYGTGFFYIPGTETCLKVGGRLRAERVENPSELGVGTVRRQLGLDVSETFLYWMPSSVDRFGGGVDFEYGLGKRGSPLGDYYGFVYGSFDYSGGKEKASGRAEIGQDGVTGTGFTFGRGHPMYGTGVIGTAPGFGLYGEGEISSNWAIGAAGYGKSFILDEEDTRSPVVVLRAGLYGEGIAFDSRAKAKLTFGGNPFPGFYQRYKMETQDYYAGVATGLDLVLFPTERTRVTVGGALNWAYHWGEAEFRQVTGVGGGNRVKDTLHFDNSGFVVGASARIELQYALMRDWTVALGYEYSYLPEVSGVDMRETPNDAELRGVSTGIDRHFGYLKMTRGF